MATSIKTAVAKSAASNDSEKQSNMSEYDKDLEIRLQALESRAHMPCKTNNTNSVDNDALVALEAKVDDLIERLTKKMSF